jgi:hypothetical protein
MIKVFERELWVDFEYNPTTDMPEFGTVDKYTTVMHALIGDCVYWSTYEFGYSKKVRVTVEVLEENE